MMKSKMLLVMLLVISLVSIGCVYRPATYRSQDTEFPLNDMYGFSKLKRAIDERLQSLQTLHERLKETVDQKQSEPMTAGDVLVKNSYMMTEKVIKHLTQLRNGLSDSLMRQRVSESQLNLMMLQMSLMISKNTLDDLLALPMSINQICLHEKTTGTEPQAAVNCTPCPQQPIIAAPIVSTPIEKALTADDITRMLDDIRKAINTKQRLKEAIVICKKIQNDTTHADLVKTANQLWYDLQGAITDDVDNKLSEIELLIQKGKVSEDELKFRFNSVETLYEGYWPSDDVKSYYMKKKDVLLASFRSARLGSSFSEPAPTENSKLTDEDAMTIYSDAVTLLKNTRDLETLKNINQKLLRLLDTSLSPMAMPKLVETEDRIIEKIRTEIAAPAFLKAQKIEDLGKKEEECVQVYMTLDQAIKEYKYSTLLSKIQKNKDYVLAEILKLNPDFKME